MPHALVLLVFLQAKQQMKRLYDLFLGVDASMIEINPFAETTDGRGACG